MANLKEIRNRITSIKSTMQITSAMKMVSAAKLKKAQDAITAMRPYSSKLTELLQNLSATLDSDASGAYSTQREVSKVLLVVITSNRGLCGGFNSSIAKLARAKAVELRAAGKTVKMLTVGKKGREQLKRDFGDIIDDRYTVSDKIDHLLNLIPPGGSLSLQSLFQEASSKIEVIVTFLALLELMKMNQFKARQDSLLGQIEIERKEIP